MKKSLIVILLVVLCNLRAGATDWNIIVVVPDDHSRRAMGIYGDTQAVTPNFDKLAREGVRFTNAYAAAPVCSPSRAALFSGKFPSQVGVHDFLMLNEKYEERGLDTSALLWPQVLKANGYTTGMIGKWHLGTAPERHPLERGFDYFVGYEQDSKAFAPVLDVNGETREVKGHTSDLFVRYAKEFITANKDSRFSLNISFREPQRPWREVPQEDLDAVAHIDPVVPDIDGVDKAWLKQITKDNYAAIHALDRAFGEVRETLEELNLADKTIVIYVGDHGMLIGHHGYFGRGAVGAIAGSEVVGSENIANLYDEAIKIPMIIHWPGVGAEDYVISTPVSNTDIYPTILSMLNINIQNSVSLQGRDLSKAVQNDEALEENPVFAQYDMENFGIAHLRMVRQGNWKMVKRFGLGADAVLVDELYDLNNDPNENNNLISEPNYQKKRGELEKLLREWMAQINDPVL